jgi:hypothetical protein
MVNKKQENWLYYNMIRNDSNEINISITLSNIMSKANK